MSFATLEEAWGGIDHGSKPRVIKATEPEPSDCEYGRYGAPIMDDIVTLYTADKPSTPQAEEVKMEVRAPIIREKTNLRKGDDYDESESESEIGEDDQGYVRPGKRPNIHRWKRTRGTLGKDRDDSSLIIELAAYVLSGVMLIFLFESFLTIGGNLRVRGY